MKNIIKAQRTWYGGGGSGSGPSPSGCCYTPITVSALQALKGANAMVQGTMYQITDVTADWQVVLLAESGSEIATQGQGIFQNLLYTEAWYDLNNNELLKIYDPLYDNSVGGAANISIFPWGSASWTNNIIDSSSTFVALPTTITSFIGNSIINNSLFDLTDGNFGVIQQNIFNGANFTAISGNVTTITYNIIDSASSVALDGATISTFSNNTISNSCNLQWGNITVIGAVLNNQFTNGLTWLASNTVTNTILAGVWSGGTWDTSDSSIYAIYGNYTQSSVNAVGANVTVEFNNSITDSSLTLNNFDGERIADNIIQYSTIDLTDAVITEVSVNLFQFATVDLSQAEMQNMNNNNVINSFVSGIATIILSNFSYNVLLSNSYFNADGANVYDGNIDGNYLSSDSSITIIDAYITEVLFNNLTNSSAIDGTSIIDGFLYANSLNQAGISVENCEFASVQQNYLDRGSISVQPFSIFNRINQNVVTQQSDIYFENVGDGIMDYNTVSNRSTITVNPAYGTTNPSWAIRGNILDWGFINADDGNVNLITSNRITTTSSLTVTGGTTANYITNNSLDTESSIILTDLTLGTNLAYNSLSNQARLTFESVTVFDNIQFNDLNSGIIDFQATSVGGNISRNIAGSQGAVTVIGGGISGDFSGNKVINSIWNLTGAVISSVIENDLDSTSFVTLLGMNCTEFWRNVFRASNANFAAADFSAIRDNSIINSITCDFSGSSYDDILGNYFEKVELYAPTTMTNVMSGNTITNSLFTFVGASTDAILFNNIIESDILFDGGTYNQIGTNEVINSVVDFAFGQVDGGIDNNKILNSSNISLNSIYISNNFSYNTISNLSTFSNTGSTVTILANVVQNVIDNGSTFELSQTTLYTILGYNTFSNSSSFTANFSEITNISKNTVSDGSNIIIDSSICDSLENNTISNGAYLWIQDDSEVTNCNFNRITNSNTFITVNTSLIADLINNNVIDSSQFTFDTCEIGECSGNTLTTNSYVFMNNVTLSDGFKGNNIYQVSEVSIDNSTITSINYNTLTESSNITIAGTTIDSIKNNNLSNYSEFDFDFTNSTVGSNISYNTLSNRSTLSLNAAATHTFTELIENTITNGSLFSTFGQDGLNVNTVQGNTVTNKGTIYLYESTGSQFIGNFVDAGTLFCGGGYTFEQTSYNTIFRGQMVIGNGANIGFCRSNNVEGPSSGTYGNLTVYGLTTMNTLEGNKVVNAGSLEIMDTVANFVGSCDWNFIANTSRITFVDTTVGSFGGQILGVKGGNVIDNGSVLTFTGGNVVLMRDNQFNKCTATFNQPNIYNSINNRFSGGSTVNIQLGSLLGNISVFDNNVLDGGSTIEVVQPNGEWIISYNEITQGSNLYIERGAGTIYKNSIQASQVVANGSSSATNEINIQYNTVINNSDISLPFDSSVTFNYNTIDYTTFILDTYCNIIFLRNNCKSGRVELINVRCDNFLTGIQNNTIDNSDLTIAFSTAAQLREFSFNRILDTSIFNISADDNQSIFTNNILNHSECEIYYNGDETNIFKDNQLSGGSYIEIGTAEYLSNTEFSYNELTAVSTILIPSRFFNMISSNKLNGSIINISGAANDYITNLNLNIMNQSTLNITDTQTYEFTRNNCTGSTITLTDRSDNNYTDNQFIASTLNLDNGSALTTCIISGISNTIASSQANATAIAGSISTFKYDLDMSNGAVYNSGTETLTLTTEQQAFGGIFNLIIPAGTHRINKIANFNQQFWNCRFQKNSGAGTAQFRDTGVGATVKLLTSSGATVNVATVPDFIEFRDAFTSGNQYEYLKGVY